MSRRFVLVLLLAALSLACPSVLRADEPTPETKQGKEAAALLGEHDAALEAEAHERAAAARAKLAVLVQTGKGVDETAFRYAQALRDGARDARNNDRARPARLMSAALEALVLQRPTDDRVLASLVQDLWGRAWHRLQGEEPDSGKALLTRAREMAARKDAGEATLDSWMWVLDDVHRSALEAEDEDWARALITEMRTVLEERGSTEPRLEEFLRSLKRQHFHEGKTRQTKAAAATFKELRKRAARAEDQPLRWQLAWGLTDAHRFALEQGRAEEAGRFLAELRAAVKTHDDSDARSSLLTALGNAAYNEGKDQGGEALQALVDEARALSLRDDVTDRERAEYIRVLRNAAEHGARDLRIEQVGSFRSEGEAVATVKQGSAGMRLQYAYLLSEAVRGYWQRGHYEAAAALVPHARTLAEHPGRAPALLEHLSRILVDVHILAERQRGEGMAAVRVAYLKEIRACAEAPDVTPAMRINLAQALHNRHLYAFRRQEAAPVGETREELRALAAKHPSEHRLRRELLDVLVREHVKLGRSSAEYALRLLNEARALVDREDAPRDHQVRLLDMLAEHIWRASVDGRPPPIASLERELRARTAGEDVTEAERRFLATGLRFRAEHEAKNGRWEVADSLLEEVKAIAFRDGATALQRSECVRALEVLAREALGAGRSKQVEAYLQPLGQLAGRSDARPYDRTRYGWALSRVVDAALQAEDEAGAQAAMERLAALFERQPVSAVATPYASALGTLERARDAAGDLDAARLLRDQIRSVVEKQPAGDPAHYELAYTLSHLVWRASRRTPVDWPTLSASLGELRRRTSRDAASRSELDELADALYRAHVTYGDAQRWPLSARTLRDLRALASRPQSSAHQRWRFARALLMEVWDLDTRETYVGIHEVMSQLRVLAEAHPRETRLLETYASGLRAAHDVLGATDEHVDPANSYLQTLRELLQAQENASETLWDEVARALANASDYAQYDVDVAKAHEILAELRELAARPGASALQREQVPYALKQLVRGCDWPQDRERRDRYLDEIERLAQRDDATEVMRESLALAYGHAFRKLPARAPTKTWDRLLRGLARLAERAEATEVQRKERANVVRVAWLMAVERGDGAQAGALASVLTGLRTRENAEVFEQKAWARALEDRARKHLVSGDAKTRAESVAALQAWVVGSHGRRADRHRLATFLNEAIRARRIAGDLEGLLPYMQAFEAVIGADPEDEFVIKRFKASR